MRFGLVELVGDEAQGKFDAAELFKGILLLSLLTRFVLAAIMPLTPDEIENIAIGNAYQWDNAVIPPLAAWLPDIISKIFGSELALVYRLPFILFGFGTSVAIYRLAEELAGPRAGLWALLLFTLSPFFLLMGGTFAVADAPMNCALAWAAVILMRSAKAEYPTSREIWIYSGIAIGLAVAADIQAALFPISAFTFAILSSRGRRWFKETGPYLAAIAGAVLVIPSVVWCFYPGAEFTTVPTEMNSASLGVGKLLSTWLAQLLFLLPPTLVFGFLGALQAARAFRIEWFWLLALLALIPIIAFNLAYLFGAATILQLSMSGWLFALPAGGAWLSQANLATRQASARTLAGFAVLIWIVMLAEIVNSRTGLFAELHSTLPSWWTNAFAVLGG